jgi:tetratricopeptide (TPR) repeat protein
MNAMNINVSPKTLRRLTAAEGYLELDLPAYALEELAAIEDSGAFEPLVQYMTGEALKEQKKFADAIEPLQRAAQMIPAPHNRAAWLSLGECFRAGGQLELAEFAEKFADAPQVEETPQIVPVLKLQITVQGPIDLARGGLGFSKPTQPPQPADE